MKSLLTTNNDRMLALQRILLGSIIFAHGAQKVLGWFGGYGWSGTYAAMSKSLPGPIVALVMLTEFFGGIALVLGALSRVAALGVSAVMIGAVLTVHLPNGLFMNWFGASKGEGYEYHLLFLAISAGVIVRGAGAWSFDAWISKLSPRTRTETQLSTANA